MVTSLLLAGVALALPTGQPQPASAADVKRSYLDELHKRQSTSVNTLLSLIATLFPVNVALQDVTDLISIAEQALANALGIDTTQNGLASGFTCATMTIVFARGTTEAGNIGAVVGPEFFSAVQSQLGGGKTVSMQGVAYPASVPGFLAGGDAGGSQTM